MRLTRRNAVKLSLACTAAALAGTPTLPAAADDALPMNDDGLHTQPWFHQSFLDLKEDLTEAHDAGKHFVIFWEQRGCPYCREMHRVNLARPEIAEYIQENFVVLQLNLYGARAVVDFDGEEMEERELARRWKVNFTPAIHFFPNDPTAVEGKDGGDAAIWRLLGYWKPFHFSSTFRYVRTGAYETEPNFQKWLSDYRDERRAAGEDVKIWE